jgi:hypothetical protein
MIMLHPVGVVPNSLQDIGGALDEVKRRPVVGGLGRCRAPVHTWGVRGAEPPRYGIYALARVSWRLDFLVSRHRRVTLNS